MTTTAPLFSRASALFNALFLAMLVLPALPGYAKDAKPISPPRRYDMALVWVADGKPREYVFVIDSALGFKTVPALKHFVGGMAAGSILTWAPTDLRLGGEPLLSSEAAMKDFQAFCLSKQVRFILVPAG